MTKQQEIEIFLKKKNIKFEDLNDRQKDILLKEDSKMWNFYTWNLKGSVA